MRRISELQIPDVWVQHCQALLYAIVESPRFQNTLAQLYDDQETWEAAAELVDATVLMEWTIQLEASATAAQDVISWLSAKDLAKIEIEDAYADGLAYLFQDLEGLTGRYVGVAVCVVQPSLRWLVQAYCERLTTSNRSWPTLRGTCGTPAAQIWAEERILGGSLSIRNAELLVTPVYRPAFTIGHDSLLEFVNGTYELPFRSLYHSQRHPRLEDDDSLYQYMKRNGQS